MRVLVVEAVMGDAVAQTMDLIREGYEVVRCQPVNGEVRPCLGLAAPGECPLESGTVEVVVDVRDADHVGVGPRELALVCARRLGIPVVTMPQASSVDPDLLAVRPATISWLRQPEGVRP